MRAPSLRQIEALIAVIETGTVSRAAEMLRISQPAASKLVHHLEADTGLQLFDREGGRLVPTARGRRLYEEADRIFGGINQLARAIEAIRREEQDRILVGAMPGLAGPFMSRAVGRFRQHHPNVYISVEARSSQFLADWIMSQRLDLALLITRIDHPHIMTEILAGHPMVCALPCGHPLAAHERLTPKELDGVPFIGFGPSSLTRRLVENAFATEGLRPNVVMDATTATNVCAFVAAGFGVTIADPLILESGAHRMEIRPFDPPVVFEFYISRPVRARNRVLVDVFVEEVRHAARDFLTGRD